MKKCVWMVVILFLIFSVTDYNQRMDEQYTFASDTAKREYLQSVIEDTTNSTETVNRVIDELLLIPDGVWIKYFRNGGSIIITYDLPSSDAVGSFSVSYITDYKIYICPEYVEYAMLHEIGHYIEYAKGIDLDKGFKVCLSERSKAISGVLENNDYFSTDTEYFAELTKLYFHKELDSDEYPLFTSYIESILSDF